MSDFFDKLFKSENLIGRSFGDLTVVDLAYFNNELNYRKYLCECKCGKTLVVDEHDLLTGEKSNCGCKYNQEYFVFKCKSCGNERKIPFNMKQLKKYAKESYVDNNGKQHYDIIYELNYMCKKCDKLAKLEQLKEEKTSEKINILTIFINNFCEVCDNVPVAERILRSKFREKFERWIYDNDMKEYKLTTNEFNYILRENYDETFIKSGGNIWMKKIKFKDNED